MHLKSIKTARDLPFGGIELVRVDKSITEVIIGGKLRIIADNTYSKQLSVLVEAPYEDASRFRVAAKIDGFDPKIVYFEGEYEAKRATEDFEAKGASVTCEKVDVQIDDEGNVVGQPVDPDAPPPAKQMADLEIPF